MTDIRPMLTPADLAKLLQVSERTARDLKIRRYYVGRQVRYRPEDVDRYLEQRQRKRRVAS